VNAIQGPGSPLDLSCQPLCRQCTGESRVLFVHLCSGTVVKVENVRGVRVTNDRVILDCGRDEAVEFDRRDVYFTSCREGLDGAPN
jgi:hypothetical protein